MLQTPPSPFSLFLSDGFWKHVRGTSYTQRFTLTPLAPIAYGHAKVKLFLPTSASTLQRVCPLKKKKKQKKNARPEAS